MQVKYKFIRKIPYNTLYELFDVPSPDNSQLFYKTLNGYN